VLRDRAAGRLGDRNADPQFARKRRQQRAADGVQPVALFAVDVKRTHNRRRGEPHGEPRQNRRERLVNVDDVEWLGAEQSGHAPALSGFRPRPDSVPPTLNETLTVRAASPSGSWADAGP